MKRSGAILSVILLAGFLLALNGCDDLYEHEAYEHGYYQRYDRDDDDAYRGRDYRWRGEHERHEHHDDDD